jgi:hypothetical protein
MVINIMVLRQTFEPKEEEVKGDLRNLQRAELRNVRSSGIVTE